MKLLLYCTKTKPYLFENVKCLKDVCNEYYTYNNNKYLENKTLNGKIVAECDYEVEEIDCLINTFTGEIIDYSGHTELRDIDLFKRSCLDLESLKKYLGKKGGYAIHIKNLHIFDKPRELSDYYKIDSSITLREVLNRTKPVYIPINKAPQNMMYCHGKKTGERYILISIKPEWLCKILNGEKTIEVRKKVLKEMLK